MQFINAAPYTNFQGIDDASKAQQSVIPLQTATHLPLSYLYTPWGPTEPTLTTSSSLAATFGDLFNQRLPHYTTQSLFASTILSQGNQVMINRILPVDVGPKARLLLSLDIVADVVQQYVRNADGTFQLDVNGNKVAVTGAGATLPGYIAKWVINQWATTPTVEAFGTVATRAGSIVSSTSVQSTLYPIAEFQGTFFGSTGNNLGLRLIVPTVNDTQPANAAQAARIQSVLCRLQMVSRLTTVSSPVITQTQSGSQWIDFAFKAGAYDPNTDQDFDFTNAIAAGYSQHNVAGNPPVYGPFETSKIYTANLETILNMIATTEAPKGLLPEATDAALVAAGNLYLVNPFTGMDINGVPYYTLQLNGPALGGSIFTPNSTYYAAGASDGTMTPATYDADVAAATLAFAPLTDMSKYPFSIIYDSGYSLTTKKALMPLLGMRPDLFIPFSTQSVLDPQNTADADASMAIALSAALGNYPESTLYGTGVCRAMIVGSSGYLINSIYKGLVPATLQLAKRFAAYMGAGNGIWDSTVPPDENPYNIVDMFYGLNATDKTALARSNDWANGLVWIENFDMNTQYFPALASVYGNDTSILKGAMNVLIACDLIKIAHKVRKQLSGNSRLTDAQFAAKSNALILAEVKGRYAGRVAVVPNTYYSTQDVANGYSWSCAITMYGNNMRTVGSSTIIARRMSDLTTTTP